VNEMNDADRLAAKFAQVDGVDVVDLKPARSPLSETPNVGGAEVVFKKAVVLQLADGSVRYGCTWEDCTFTGESSGAIISGHWKVHEITPDLRRVPFKDWTLEQILGRLMDADADINALMAQRDRILLRRNNTDKMDALKAENKELRAKVDSYERALKTLGKLIPSVNPGD